jgi:hypothetical protein
MSISMKLIRLRRRPLAGSARVGSTVSIHHATTFLIGQLRGTRSLEPIGATLRTPGPKHPTLPHERHSVVIGVCAVEQLAEPTALLVGPEVVKPMKLDKDALNATDHFRLNQALQHVVFASA